MIFCSSPFYARLSCKQSALSSSQVGWIGGWICHSLARFAPIVAPTRTHTHPQSLEREPAQRWGGWLIIAPWTDPSQERDWLRRLTRHADCLPLCLLRRSPRWNMPVAANTFVSRNGKPWSFEDGGGRWFCTEGSQSSSAQPIPMFSAFPLPSASMAPPSRHPSECSLPAKPVPSNSKHANTGHVICFVHMGCEDAYRLYLCMACRQKFVDGS